MNAIPLELPDVTLFAIDCVKPQRTVDMMRWSSRFVRFAESVILTDTSRHKVSLRDIRVVHHVESDRKVSPPNMPQLRLPVDYERAVLRETFLHFKTSHVLHMEWDSAVLNPSAWDRRWLKYDYIGAPWPVHNDPGWPACDGKTNAVGNGGFSLKSRRFCELVRNLSLTREGEPAMLSSDQWQCRTIRPELEKQGVKFAPPGVAARFSCEHMIYSGQFGFHGKSTALMNNWQGPFADIR